MRLITRGSRTSPPVESRRGQLPPDARFIVPAQWSELTAPLLVTAVALGWSMALALRFAPDGYAALLRSWDGHHFLAIAAEGYPAEPGRDATGTITDPRWAFYPVFPYLLRVATSATGLPYEFLVPTINGAAALAAMVVIYMAARRFTSRAVSTAVVALVATSMSFPVWTLAYSDTLGLLGVAVVLSLMGARRFGWLVVAMTILGLTRPVMAPLAAVTALNAFVDWRRQGTTGRSPWPLTVLSIWALLCAFLWPTVVAVVTGHWSTYWETENAYQEPGMVRSWVFWAMESPVPGLLIGAFLFIVVLWVATRAAPDQTPLNWRAWLVMYPAYIASVTFVSAATIRLLLPTFPAALALAPLAERRVGRIIVIGACMIGLGLQGIWITKFVVPLRGLVP